MQTQTSTLTRIESRILAKINAPGLSQPHSVQSSTHPLSSPAVTVPSTPTTPFTQDPPLQHPNTLSSICHSFSNLALCKRNIVPGTQDPLTRFPWITSQPQLPSHTSPAHLLLQWSHSIHCAPRWPSLSYFTLRPQVSYHWDHLLHRLVSRPYSCPFSSSLSWVLPL